MPKYDIFISFKNTDCNEVTPDTAIATELYTALKAVGFTPFFSKFTLEEEGVSQFKKSIDSALEQADTLIVVLSKARYADAESSKWVSYEVDTFQIAELSGAKPNARLFTLLTHNVRTEELPYKLNRAQCFYYEDGIDKLVHYLTGTKPTQQQKETPPQSVFKYCKRCGKATKKNAVFCSACKCKWFFNSQKEYDDNKNVKYCTVCGTKNDLDDKFCCQCGNERFVSFFEEYLEIKQQEDLRKKKRAERTDAGVTVLNDCLVEFGSYPQEEMPDDVVIISHSDENGYCEGSDGELYAQAKNGIYYRVSPIKWRILQRNGDKMLIVSDKVLDSCRFHAGNNNYANSDISDFLNKTFFYKAFNEKQRKIVLTTTVDNGLGSTCDAKNGFVCGTTHDKVFLLSRFEATTFITSNGERQREVTPFAKGNGAYFDSESGFGWWWLRSPSYHNATNARTVHDGGSICSHSVNFDNNGVVPAIWIETKLH